MAQVLHQLFFGVGSFLPIKKEVFMESLLIIVGPTVIASLWLSAGLAVSYEMAEMYKDFRGL
jgi:hypothetical protein